MNKRILSILLLFVMIFVSFSAVAFADEDGETTEAEEAKPVFTEDKTAGATAFAMTYGTAIEDSAVIHVTAYPVLKKLSYTGTLPAGVTLTTALADDKLSGTFTLSGTPTEVLKKVSITLTAENKLGKTNLKLALAVAEDSTKPLTIYVDSAGGTAAVADTHLPHGNYVKGKKITDKNIADTAYETVTYYAFPGPVTWKVKGLPNGITSKVDEKTQALTLAGTFGKASSFKDGAATKTEYTITATNKNMETKTAELKNDIVVWEAPAFKTASLKAVKAGKDYTGKLAFTGNPTAVKVEFAATSSGDYTADELTFKTSDGETDAGKLTWDSKNSAITGSFTKIPAGGKVYAKVSIGNPAGGLADATADEPAVATGDTAITKVYEIAVTGDKPAFAKPEALEFDDDTTSLNITTTKGTMPVTISAYIDAATAEKFSNGAVKTKIDLKADEADANFGLKFECKSDDTDGSWPEGATGWGVLSFTSGDNIISAYKGLKVTFEAVNDVTGTTSPVKKAFAFNQNADVTPGWYKTSEYEEGAPTDGATELTGETITVSTIRADSELSAENIANAIYPLPAGTELPNTVTDFLKFTADVLIPYTVDVSPTEANGIKATVTKNAVTFSGTPTAGKDTTTKFKLTATNTASKKKAAMTVVINAFAAPEVSNADALNKYAKEFVAGKKVSIKPKIKVSKKLADVLTYALSGDDGIITADGLASLDLKFNSETGEIAGDAAKPTLSDGETPAYDESKKTQFRIAGFSATPVDAPIALKIKPVVPKIKTSKLTLKISSTADENSGAIEVSNISDTDISGGLASLTYSATDLPKGVTLSGDTLVADPTTDGITAKANVSATITASNYGVTGTKAVKITLVDDTPVISGSSEDLTITADSTKAVTASKALTVSPKTGDTVIKWKVSTKPASGVSVKLTPASNGASCTVAVTAKKGAGDIETTVGIVATNSLSKENSDEFTFAVKVTGVAEETEDSGSKKNKKDKTKSSDETEAEESERVLGEGEVTQGVERTAEGLTDAERSAIAEAGYIIAAVLPETSVTEPGQYDFTVALNEEIEEGRELVWFAFPRDAEPSEDDEIVDFFNEDGEDIEEVPASKTIIVSPWLNPDVTYAPVIAVKADTGEEGAMTEDEIAEEVVEETDEE